MPSDRALYRAAAIAVASSVFLLLWVLPGVALAGPGGEIVEAVFKTQIGRIIGGILALILLPVILYVYGYQYLAIWRAKKSLRTLAEDYPQFDWDELEEQAKAAAHEIYAVWSSGDLTPAAEHMMPAYFESQQAILDRWKEEGKTNVCRMNKFRKVRPLRVAVENEQEFSSVAVIVTLDLVDYLEQKGKSKPIKGTRKRLKNEDFIWTFVAFEGRWRLASIEDGSLTLAYARAGNRLDTAMLERRSAERPRREAPVPERPPQPRPAPRRASAQGSPPPSRSETPAVDASSHEESTQAE